MKAIVLPLLLACPLSWAQPAPSEFPDGAAAVTPESLKGFVSDKVFAVNASKGPPWRLQFNADGLFYVNIGYFSDTGRWTIKDGSLCTEAPKIRPSCNEVRAKGQELYLKRDNGEIVKLEPR
ncbi:MAG: hypothetical protein LCI02_17660 [Proteobacteria bacterium]|nr:hypothetical protein [Pseudomonadota bacterium]